MRDTPLWLRGVAAAAVFGMLIAITKPPVAPFVLRGLVVAAAVLLAGATIVGILHDVIPADGAGRRPDPRQPGDLPRELAQLTDELSKVGRRDPVPPVAMRVLRGAFQHRLWYRHGLTSAQPAHRDIIQQMVSPTAWALLLSAHPEHEYPRIPSAALPALIDEAEHL